MPFSIHKIPLVIKPEIKEVSKTVIDLFLHKIQDGFTFSAAARALSIPQAQLRPLLSRIGEAELQEAMRIGAETLVDRAGEELQLADDKESIDKAKALAQHYRWLASKLNKIKYGESVKVDGNVAPSYTFNMILDAAQSNEKLINGKANVLEHK